jgi:peptide subunit release factor 1 (eRF1)
MIGLRGLPDVRYPELALSLYMPAGPALHERYYVALFKDLVKEKEAPLDKNTKAALHRESERVRAFLEEESLPGKPFAVFSSEPADLFEAFWLPEDVTTEIALDERLQLGQVLQQARRHPPAFLVLIDREEARIFTAFLGRIKEVADLKGEPIKRHKKGGLSDDKFQRHEDLQVKWNLKVVVEWLYRQDPNGKIPLYLAGPVEDRAAFRRLLPKVVQQAVRKEFAAPMHLSSGELGEQLKAFA